MRAREIRDLNAKDAKMKKTLENAKEFLLRALCEFSFASFAVNALLYYLILN